MKTNNNNNKFPDFDTFVGGLQKEDVRNLKITRTFQPVMIILAVLYALVFQFDTEGGWEQRVGGICYAIGFLLFALIFRKFYKEYRDVDYGVPVVEMLTSAIKRYKMFQRKMLLIIAPVLFIDLGMILITVRIHDGDFTEAFWSTQMLLVPALLFGLVIGLIIARKRQKPLRDAALMLLKEIQS